MVIERFEDIRSWQEARKLAAEVCRLTGGDVFYRDFVLTDQIRRAATSCMANIAEGFGRGTRKEFVHFLNIAKASALEVQSHLYMALDLGYITQAQFDAAYQLAASTARLIGGFINYLSNRRTDH